MSRARKPNGDKYCPAFTEGGQQGQHDHVLVVVQESQISNHEVEIITVYKCRYCEHSYLVSKVIEAYFGEYTEEDFDAQQYYMDTKWYLDGYYFEELHELGQFKVVKYADIAN